MGDLPEGVVTFLFTDVEGSTRLFEDSPDSMLEALRQHDQAIEDAIAGHGGVPVRPRGEGDSRFIVFANAHDAVAGAAAMQTRLAETDWPTPRPLKVRAALHTGSADLRWGDYYGSAVNRAARLRGIAHGGQTILSGTTHELVEHDLPRGVSLRDLGRHGLKDLTEPEQVFQLDVEGLDDRFPPLASLNAIPNNLPQQVTEFIGREKELAEVGQLLGEARLVTVLAPGGVGKTRLALQAAAERTADYPDGVFFIGLADIGSSDDIVLEVAEAIGLGFSSDEDVQVQLLTYLATKHQLLVFDNFEHLLDRAGLVASILKAAPDVSVLATSRAKLNLTGETLYTLGGLDIARVSLEDAERVSGARLFVDAARRAKPGFALQPDDLDPLNEILRLTDGIPLGILLAAAWVDMLSVKEIAAEIARSLDFLESELRDLPERQRSVRAVFEHSWSLLTPDQQELYSSLSIFRGGFTRDASESIAGASLRDLAALGGMSLVSPSPDTGRYTVHELLRQFAEEELRRDPDRVGRLAEAHADYYSRLVEDAWGLFTVSDEPKMAAIIEADLDNIRLAWRHLAATQNAPGIRKMIGGLWMSYEFRGWYPPAIAVFDEALEGLDEHSTDSDMVTTRALVRGVRAFFLTMLGQAQEALDESAAALDVMRTAEEAEGVWIAMVGRFVALIYLGRFDEVIALADEGVAVAESFDDPFWAVVVAAGSIFPLIASGDIDRARRLLDEESAVLEPRGEHQLMSWNQGHRARLALFEERPKEAVELFGRAVELSKDLGYPRGLHVNLAGLGGAQLAAGDPEAAETAFIESLAVAEKASMVREMLGMIAKIAQVRSLTGRPTDAVELYAVVIADPSSTQRFLGDPGTIRENAAAALAGLEAQLDSEDYAAAYARGTETPYDIAAKELIRSL